MVEIRSKLVDPRGGHNRYSCNFDFFKQWNPEMAYVLGFLYADGNITNAICSRTQYIQFNNNDKEILEAIGTTMGSKHPLRVVPPRTVTYRNGVYTGAESFKLRIGSRIMFNDLLNLGLIPHKSKTVLFPSVPPHCLSHFTGDSVKIFKFIYKDRPEQLYLKRKFAVFQKYFNLSSRINRIDHEVESMLGRRDSLMTECLRS